jgi:hypothetical protein
LWQVRGDRGRAVLEWERRGAGQLRRASAQWVIDRAWCVYRCLDLNHVPRADRPQALALKLSGLAPFRRAGHYVVWRGGLALVWSWDEQVREEAVESCSEVPLRYCCVPESLLQAPPRLMPGAALVRLLRIRSGVDLQVWQGQGLVMSHFFPVDPKPEQYLHLLRGLLGVELPERLTPENCELLGRPWARPALGRAMVQWDRWLPHGLAAALVLGGGLNLGQGLSWWWAERSLRSQYDSLNTQVEPVLSARNMALRANQAATDLGRALRQPSQISMLEQVAALLPEDSRLLAWRYRGQELELEIGTSSADPRLYVSRFMEAGNFENVRVEPSPQGDGISLNLTLRPAREDS